MKSQYRLACFKNPLFATTCWQKGRGKHAAIKRGGGDAYKSELWLVNMVHEGYLAWALIVQNKVISAGGDGGPRSRFCAK